MADDVVISTEHLGKRFQLGAVQQYKTLRDSLTALARRPIDAFRQRRAAHRPQELWALRGVNLSIRRGETVGVIGGNGAGKSTLLKILSRITEPSEGSGIVRGRVGSLLEVGTGFHPELTGRENIFLNGAILGMPRADIRRKLDPIIAFAEVERFLDTPVKHYSSGMYMRLAFSVAAHLEPDILMVDEVLAVGDAAFQRKCLGRMGEVAGSGRTVLFVSHNLAQVRTLCSRAVWLHGGAVREDGPCEDVVNHYLAHSGAELRCERSFAPGQGPGDARMRLSRVATVGTDRQPQAVFGIEEEIRIEMDCEIATPLQGFDVVMEVNSQEGQIVFCSASYDRPGSTTDTPVPPGRYRFACTAPRHLLNRGSYNVSVWGLTEGFGFPITAERVVQFEVSEIIVDNPRSHRRRGVVRPLLPWTVERLEGGAPPSGR